MESVFVFSISANFSAKNSFIKQNSQNNKNHFASRPQFDLNFKGPNEGVAALNAAIQEWYEVTEVGIKQAPIEKITRIVGKLVVRVTNFLKNARVEDGQSISVADVFLHDVETSIKTLEKPELLNPIHDAVQAVTLFKEELGKTTAKLKELLGDETPSDIGFAAHEVEIQKIPPFVFEENHESGITEPIAKALNVRQTKLLSYVQEIYSSEVFKATEMEYDPIYLEPCKNTSPITYAKTQMKLGHHEVAEQILSSHLQSLINQVDPSNNSLDIFYEMGRTFIALGDYYSAQGKTHLAEESYKHVLKFNHIYRETHSPVFVNSIDRHILSLLPQTPYDRLEDVPLDDIGKGSFTRRIVKEHPYEFANIIPALHLIRIFHEQRKNFINERQNISATYQEIFQKLEDLYFGQLKKASDDKAKKPIRSKLIKLTHEKEITLK